MSVQCRVAHVVLDEVLLTKENISLLYYYIIFDNIFN